MSLPQMSWDKVLLANQIDHLILSYGAKLFKRNGKEKHLHSHIRNKVQEIGIFLLMARSVNQNLETLCTIIDPKHFETVIKTMQMLAEFDKTTCTYKKPSLALKSCTFIKKSESIMKEDKCKRKNAEDFIELCEYGWATEISSDALDTLHKRKFNKPTILPLAKDMQKLQNYLGEKLVEFSEKLETEVNKTA